MLPTTTANVLSFLFPAADPATAWTVNHDPGKVRDGQTIRPADTRIAAWNLPDPQPSDEAITAAAASPEFAAWLAERTDPAKNAKRQARAWLSGNDPVAVAMRAVVAELGASLRHVRGAGGLTNRTDEQFLGDVLAKLQ